jgi:hypothetical protein
MHWSWQVRILLTNDGGVAVTAPSFSGGFAPIPLAPSGIQ